MMAKAKDQKPEDKITSMRDVRLNDREKRGLFIIGAVLMIAFAAAVVIGESLAGQSNAGYYPGGCGNLTTYASVYSCISTLANRTLNTSTCGYLPSAQQQSCVYYIAQRSQNVSKCGLINPSSAYYTQCILTLNKNIKSVGLCGYLSQSDVLPCIYNTSVALNFSNPLACDQLSNATYLSSCKNLFYFKEALGTSNGVLCSYMRNNADSETFQFLNYNTSAQSITNMSSTLEQYAELGAYNLTPQGYCYYRLAISEDNASMCSNIGGALATQCGYYIAALNASLIKFNLNATNITLACGTYNGYKANLCTTEYATGQAFKTKTIAPCYLMNSSLNRDDCIMRIALNTSNSTECLKISNATLQVICEYIQNATTTK